MAVGTCAFTVDQTLESFLRGHVEAFAVFQGTARTLVYDNLRSAVLERAGTAIRFHPRAARARLPLSLRAAAVYAGAREREGKSRAAAQYLRHAFFAALSGDALHADRFILIGYSQRQRLLFVVHAEVRQEVIRIISARRATSHEKAHYESD